mgnify:CR=1 FL=1
MLLICPQNNNYSKSLMLFCIYPLSICFLNHLLDKKSRLQFSRFASKRKKLRIIAGLFLLAERRRLNRVQNLINAP